MQAISDFKEPIRPIIKRSDKKDLFVKIEMDEHRTIYHTKIMMDIYKFGFDSKKNIFRLSLRKLFNQLRVEEFRLHKKEGDKFIGIFYGYRKPIKNVFVKYEINGTKKSYAFSKAYYIEFRFQKGSIFCYFKGLFRLLKKERVDNFYNKTLIRIFTELEEKVYEFYGKKYPKKGILLKWIKKNQK
ncbi:conserved hypothetical protein (plasmid) [Borreliella valaisiana VS116]|uniref:Plasmid partitioning associated protein-1 n=1 Tax=Borreliella valaisiana VS116 TaxID=445987 RepID=C0R8L4_BORVA|nr:DUF226 domain-containing protein [Borreliella valaisiana]ACN52805.1 conserved hypothetical protein [Borreliella valaisiana VS116]